MATRATIITATNIEICTHTQTVYTRVFTDKFQLATQTFSNTGVARIFSGGGGVHFSWLKIWWLFLVITFFSMAMSIIYCHQLPFFISSAGVHLAKFTPFLPHFNKNCLENFFPSPRRVHLHPLNPLATPMVSNLLQMQTVKYISSVTVNWFLKTNIKSPMILLHCQSSNIQTKTDQSSTVHISHRYIHRDVHSLSTVCICIKINVYSVKHVRNLSGISVASSDVEWDSWLWLQG